MKRLFLIALISALPALAVEPDPRLLRLEAAYEHAQREQQAVYQQFMMAQELRRNELQKELPGGGYGPIYRGPNGLESQRPLDYDENQRRQRERQDRLNRLEQDIAQSYSRYLELGKQKQAIQEQIRALGPAR